MDTGHYNCRDYDVSPHFSPTTIVNKSKAPLIRHESYSELEQRSRSPASLKPKFPLLRLPLELRQHIYSYLIPRTQELRQSNPLGNHARNFSAVQKRGARGMVLPAVSETSRIDRSSNSSNASPVVWIRGCISLMGVCRQIHHEVASMMYGQSTFLLFVTFSGITFRFRWMLSSGMAPSRSYDFLELMPARYLHYIRKLVVHVDHVDSYTGMIKFNISGKGLIHGLRKQVQRLVLALQPVMKDSNMGNEHLSKVVIRISSSNAVLDTIKTLPPTPFTRDTAEAKHCQPQSGTTNVTDDIKEVLEPFTDLIGVRDVRITGAIPNDFAEALEKRMQSSEPRVRHTDCCDHGIGEQAIKTKVPLCVYGNDID